MQDLCLADGSVVVAEMTGHLRLTTGDDGTGRVLVAYGLAIPGGTLEGTVHTRFSQTSFDARVHAFGGTGVLLGMTGRGTHPDDGPQHFRRRDGLPVPLSAAVSLEETRVIVGGFLDGQAEPLVGGRRRPV